jgi:hypothetical protein
MIVTLPSELDFLLREVAENAGIAISAIRKSGGQWQLTSAERHTLMNAVSDEFARSGLQRSDEPNQRGLLLADVLDRLNAIGSIPGNQ